MSDIEILRRVPHWEAYPEGARARPLGAGMVNEMSATELGLWLADEMELGERVARAFRDTGRCPYGELDQVVFDLLRAQGRSAAQRGLLCHDDAHRVLAFEPNLYIHCPRAAASVLYWCKTITTFRSRSTRRRKRETQVQLGV